MRFGLCFFEDNFHLVGLQFLGSHVLGTDLRPFPCCASPVFFRHPLLLTSLSISGRRGSSKKMLKDSWPFRGSTGFSSETDAAALWRPTGLGWTCAIQRLVSVLDHLYYRLWALSMTSDSHDGGSFGLCCSGDRDQAELAIFR